MKDLKNFINKINEGFKITKFNDDELTFTIEDFINKDHHDLIDELMEDPSSKAYAFVLTEKINSKYAKIILETIEDNDGEKQNPIYKQCKDYLKNNCTNIYSYKPSYDSKINLWQLNNSFFIVIDYSDQGGSFFIVPKNGEIE